MHSQHAHPVAEKRERPVRVLLAEDDDELRDMLVWALRRDGYQVIAARDGTELADLVASALCRESTAEPFDLLVSDIRMPGWTGLQILTGIRHADWSFPVILITAFGDGATLREAKRLGATAVFTKPFSLSDLRTAVHHLLPSNRSPWPPSLIGRR